MTGPDHPAAAGLVVDRGLDPRVELDVATQIEAIGDVVGVLQDLGLPGIALAPVNQVPPTPLPAS
jgi:hypothetical protein